MAKKAKRKSTLRRKPKRGSLEALERFTFAEPVDLLQAEDGDGENECKRFSMVAYSGGRMYPRMTGGYSRGGLVLDLAGWRFKSGQSAVNWQHQRTNPVGHIDKQQVTNQVRVQGALSVPGVERTKIVKAAADGYKWRVSVEGEPNLDRLDEISAGQTVTVNGRKFRGPITVARAGVFTGVGFVTNAGDSGASATIAAELTSERMESGMDWEDFLEACGVDEDDATEDQLTTLRAAFDAQYGDPDDTPDDEPEEKPRRRPKRRAKKKAARRRRGGLRASRRQREVEEDPELDAEDEEEAELTAAEQQRAELAADLERINEIKSLCANADNPTIKVDKAEVDLCAHAIRENMSATEVELHILRHSAPQGPAIQSRSGSDSQTIEAMTAACLLEAGVPIDSPHLQCGAAEELGIPEQLRAGINDDNRQKALEAAHRYGDVSYFQLAADCLAAEGKPVPRSKKAIFEAAASSGRLHEVYQATVGASLLVGYMEAPRTLDKWTGVDEVDDFKEQQRFREDLPEDLAYIPPNGEADHSTTGAEYETLAVDMFGRQREIGYHDYRNNNLGLINRTPRNFGVGAYRSEEKLGYAELLSNPVMNSTGQPLFNVAGGTDYASLPLNHDNADTLIAALMAQTIGEETLDFDADFALVPTQLRSTAGQVYGSAFIGEDNGQGTRNAIFEYGVEPIGIARLAAGARHPKDGELKVGSTTTHYLGTRSVEVAARVYMRGHGRAPAVRVTPLTQGKWGTHIDVMHIFGFAFLSSKGLIRARA